MDPGMMAKVVLQEAQNYLPQKRLAKLFSFPRPIILTLLTFEGYRLILQGNHQSDENIIADESWRFLD
jgi:hypothetical protein